MMAYNEIIHTYCRICTMSGDSTLKDCLLELWESCHEKVEVNSVYQGSEDNLFEIIQEYAVDDEGCRELLNSIELQLIFKGSR